MHITVTPNEVYALVTAVGLIAAIALVLFDVFRQIKRTVRESYLLATTSEPRSHWILVRVMARLAAPAVLINVAVGERWLWRAVAPSPEGLWFDKPIATVRDVVDTILVGTRGVLWSAAQLEVVVSVGAILMAAVFLVVHTDLPTTAAEAFGRARDSVRRALASLRDPAPVSVAAMDSGSRPE
ncbi:hypothetical protein [Mycobacterium sp. D16R24]|uniref:hypothetical protein n=1 Tax=Mycobacterium sp. D16R24 TaxID=1855656 RepID=UPI000993AF85|nr:hypothetical protein [Mycobacterium sp. D16R24]